MNFVLTFWREHGTKLLGLLQVTAGALATMDQQMIADLLGPNAMRWIIMATGILTAWRGFVNSDNRERSDQDAKDRARGQTQ